MMIFFHQIWNILGWITLSSCRAGGFMRKRSFCFDVSQPGTGASCSRNFCLFHAFWSWTEIEFCPNYRISYFDQILHFHLSSAVATISQIFGAATEIGWKIEFHPHSTHTFGPSILLSKLEIFNYFVLLNKQWLLSYLKYTVVGTS